MDKPTREKILLVPIEKSDDDVTKDTGCSASLTVSEKDHKSDAGGKTESAVSPESGRKDDTGAPDASSKSDRRLALFVANIGVLSMLWMVFLSYTMGVIRTLERQFGLTSTQTGWFGSCHDIAHNCIVIFIGYYGRRNNKPRILCISILFSAVAGLLMAGPYWLTSSTPLQLENSTSRSVQFCAARQSRPFNDTEKNQCRIGDIKDSSSSLTPSVHPAYYFFVVAHLCNGVAGSGLGSLSLAYVDENASKNKSPIYLGILAGMFMLGPLCGLMLASLTLAFPENLSGTTGNRTDSTWIGCWWLGYLLCSIGTFLFAIPMWFFPTSLKTSKEDHSLVQNQARDVGTGEQHDHVTLVRTIWKLVTAFARDVVHLLKNKPYLALLGITVTGPYVITAIGFNMVRYIEIHFLQPAFVASALSAVILAVSSAIGGLSGGLLMSKLKLKTIGAVKLEICCCAVFLVGMTVALVLHCPQLQMAGLTDITDQKYSVHTSCSRRCACAESQESYKPVCASDGQTYFSACFAGCSDIINTTYVGCQCTAERNSTVLGSARFGLCQQACTLIIPYTVVLFIAFLVGALGTAPGTIVLFRVIEDDERSFALALDSFVSNLLGFIPAPLLFGSLIDSTCRLWEQKTTSCEDVVGGSTGSCLLFDTAKFRQRTYGPAIGFELVAFVLLILLYFLIRNRVFNEDDTKQRSSKSPDEKSIEL